MAPPTVLVGSVNVMLAGFWYSALLTNAEYAAVKVKVTLAPPGIVKELQEGIVAPAVGFVVDGRVAGIVPPSTTELVAL